MNEPIIIQSSQIGPKVVILGGVHGNETCGVKVLDQLQNLTINKGQLTLMYGNPMAIKQNVRFVEQNLNRMFVPDQDLSITMRQSYEYQRSREILPYLQAADYLLDIHASFTPGSLPFIICESNGALIAQHFPHLMRCYGFAVIEPGGTDGFMNNNGKVGLCVECGYLADVATNEIGYETARSFLAALGLIDRKLTVNSLQQVWDAYYLYHTKTNSFRLTKEFTDFEDVKPGQTIGYDGNEAVNAFQNEKVLFARNRDKIGDEAFILVKKAV
ncbi:MAG: succinylglutamate desuccinylase/aspartoacylase family protein [Candidatus Abawacabacteria bacterium]|nr:succinylglutamate desuccinylase/aspartoacylase family protein [Candidatus Abawacabacteria bacterium]